jgi:tetratricopeptide (TPR) repeat protein
MGQTEEARLKSHLAHLQEAFLLEEHQPGVLTLHERYKKLIARHFDDSIELHRRAAEYYRSYSRHPRDYLEAAFHYFEAGEYDRSVRILSRRIPLLLRRGYLKSVEELLNRFEGARLHREDRALLYLALGDLAEYQKQWDKSLEYYKRASAVLNDAQSLSLTYHRIAKAYQFLGESAQALKAYEESLALLKKRSDLRGIGQTLHQMGLLFHAQGLYDKADSHFQESLQIREGLGDRKGRSETLYNLGLLERDRNQNSKALDYLREALEVYREIKHPEINYLESLIQALEKDSN